MQLQQLHESLSVTGLDWTRILERHLSNTDISQQLHKNMAEGGALSAWNKGEQPQITKCKSGGKSVREVLGYIRITYRFFTGSLQQEKGKNGKEDAEQNVVE